MGKMYGSAHFFEWIQIIVIAFMAAFVVENFIFGFAIVQGQSMYPTLNTNDRLVVIKFSYFWNCPQAGDIVVFQPPNTENSHDLFVKRVVAVENDHFFIKEGVLYINEHPIKEDYILNEEYLERDYHYIEGVVPVNSIFVLGDNRNDSNDSRNFGFITQDRIKGKVILKIWPLKEIQVFMNPIRSRERGRKIVNRVVN